MKKDRRLLTTLLIALLVGTSVFLTACFNNDEDDSDYVPETAGGAMTASLLLPSDSENGSEWSFEQETNLFTCEDAFVDNGGDEEGSSESQQFYLVPETPGTTTITFTNEAEGITYTYELEVSDDLTLITLNKSEGTQAGAAVEAPELKLERD